MPEQSALFGISGKKQIPPAKAAFGRTGLTFFRNGNACNGSRALSSLRNPGEFKLSFNGPTP